ncbi:hypothetical protein QTP70_025149 [Hemibagrus guttatus]|uniref:Guanylate cyclase n=1 Tax=Hemibagrus guttatus TaxID=175788 RepID=A0AAE0R8J6_9TELE|nr:hypothetical protein QTP70_025149 [Hemibagrus guttatus]
MSHSKLWVGSNDDTSDVTPSGLQSTPTFLSRSPEMRRRLCAFYNLPPEWASQGLQTSDQCSSYHHQYGHLSSCSVWHFWASVILLCLLYPVSSAASIFRVGVVGPWSCDLLFAKAYPSAAAQLAVSRINQDPSLYPGVTFDYVILEEDCETSQALSHFLGYYVRASAFVGPVNPGYCDAASLLAKSWNKAVFSWSCIGGELDARRNHPTFVRTMPLPTLVLLHLMQHFRWAHVGIISSGGDIWIETANKVANTLRSHGMPVGIVAAIGKDMVSMRKTLAKVKRVENLRLVILCMHSVLIGGKDQQMLLEMAHDMRMTEGSMVFVPYDTLLYSLPYQNLSQYILPNNSKLLHAYDAVLTITVKSPERHSFYQAYTEAQTNGELPKNIKPHQVRGQRRLTQIQLVRGPNKILLTLADVTFINPSLSNKKMSLEESKTSDTRKSLSERSHTSPFSSQSPATYENSNIAIFEGDWAWLKRLPHGNFRSINPSTTDVFELMKDMRHENVNPFMGFFHDCGVFAIVTEYCSRGSLEDLLHNDDVKLDWMFKSSLLLDLIKGMKYLHHRNVCHGRLKSRNCVVDGRFVLKVTDYGYNEVLESQRFLYIEPVPEELLWTAPEILRSSYPGLKGSLAGDVYSFSIIMQEVVVRGPPFCMLEQSAQEIVQKVRKPPPLCRPTVSQDHAPLECIQLMKQCWNEQPERRPTFDEIFDQFKNINKGKKTNIIDSMLRMLEQYSSNLEELIRERTEELEIEKQKTEKLLTQMLPPSVAEALKLGTTVKPEYFDSVTVYFSDIVGFTTISANSEPIEVVDLLNDLYTLFDAIISNHDVYKVETIGDAYMVASGLPVPNGSRHAAEISNMALDILSAVGTFKMRHMPDVPVRIRIGLHTGPCVAGVVGLTMPRYCLFGDTVNTASRMESTGMPYRIHVHSSTVKILMALNAGYKVQLRGRIELKGKGTEETYWLIGRDSFTKPLPVPPELKSGQMAHGLQMEEIAAYKRRKAEKELAKKNN